MDFSHTPKRYFDLSTMSYEELNAQCLSGDMAGWQIIDRYDNADTGYSAMAFKNPDGGVIIAHRGTDSAGDWAYPNLDIVNNKVPEQFHDAERFVEKVFDQENASLIVEHTGHSLGGAVAQMIAHKYDSKSIAFDPPGTKEIIEKIPSLAGEVDHRQFQSYIMDGSPVNMVNTQVGFVTRVKLDSVLTDVGFDPFAHKLENIKSMFNSDGQIKENLIDDEFSMARVIKEDIIEAAAENIAEHAGAVRDGIEATIDFAKDAVHAVGDTIDKVKGFVFDEEAATPLEEPSNVEIENTLQEASESEFEFQEEFRLADDLEGLMADLYSRLARLSSLSDNI